MHRLLRPASPTDYRDCAGGVWFEVALGCRAADCQRVRGWLGPAVAHDSFTISSRACKDHHEGCTVCQSISNRVLLWVFCGRGRWKDDALAPSLKQRSPFPASFCCDARLEASCGVEPDQPSGGRPDAPRTFDSLSQCAARGCNAPCSRAWLRGGGAAGASWTLEVAQRQSYLRQHASSSSAIVAETCSGALALLRGLRAPAAVILGAVAGLEFRVFCALVPPSALFSSAASRTLRARAHTPNQHALAQLLLGPHPE